MNKKIDFVIMWVDGNDIEWQKEKAKYSQTGIIDNRLIRYREWDNLKYWFRGVEKFAPWVNKIHFVTNGQKPDWLNLDAPKLNFVTHKDFMDSEYLPTFSANPIELNLHRIDGIADQFVLFNDDMFVIKPVREKDFFKDGMPCMSIGLDIFCYEKKDVFSNILQNDMEIFRKYFDNKEFVKNNFWKIYNLGYGLKDLKSVFLFPWTFFFIPGFFNHHLPNPLLKKTYEDVWEKENDLLDKVCRNKFRSVDDVNQYIFEYWQYGKGQCSPKSLSRFGQVFNVDQSVDAVCDCIIKHKKKVICINDGEVEDFEFAKEKINSSFEQILPDKCAFEKV